jgi:serine/threonine protein kinase/Tol biopolymer transport system component
LIGGAVSHYEVLERLGGGGMGVVYKAWDPRLERYVALKFLSDSRGEDEDRQRFVREARTASVLDHPNICHIYEIGEAEDGRLFIAMAFCEGESLKKKLDRGPLALAQAIDLAAQVAAGLAEAHGKKIVHRDVKPANVMVAADGRAKIVDFGIAWLAGQTRLTQTGSVVGTTAYLAPEQFRREVAGHRADLWSLGVVLYEMIAGSLPFSDETEGELVRSILKSVPPPLAKHRRGVPPALDQIVGRALAKRPADRYPTAAAMRADLLAAAPAAVEAEIEAEETLLESPRSGSRGGRAWSVPVGSEGTTDAGGKRPSLVGRTVGHYRILEHLGGGGMGVVFKAEDLKLARTVALKFLPFELTRDPEAKARFLQEARTASAIDHPNICTIHEIGETDEGQLYLAMACYDGETLKKRLAHGPLQVDEAVDVAQQIARGLGKAHRKGIIHRDIKPANLMITSDAVVKILDFGIAKLAGSAILTRIGASVGSPGYMSPEQAHGEEVDARTDLWALGAVTYEMLAGRRPFRGEHDQSILYSLFHDTPEALNRVRTDVSPELGRIVDRLLAKDREARYATAADVLADLRTASGQSSTGGGTAPTAIRLDAVTSTGRRSDGRWRRVWGGLAGLVGAGALALGAWALFGRSSNFAARAPATSAQANYTRLTSEDGSEVSPTLSPDGKTLVYAKSVLGKFDLYLKQIGGDDTVKLTSGSSGSDTQPAFSPDGREIAFRSDREGGGIFIFSLQDRSVRRVTDFGFNPAWSPDGHELVCASESVADPWHRFSTSQLWRIDVGTGARRLISPGDAVQPSWSPNGHRIAYWGLPAGSANRVIWTTSADGGEAVRVTTDPYVNWDPVWSPDGSFLYFASDRSGSMNLWRVAIDQDTGRVVGPPEPINTPSQSSSQLTIASKGHQVAYATSEGRSNLESVPFDPIALGVTGLAHAITEGSRAVRRADASPDGRWIVFDTQAPEEHLFVVRPDGTGLRQITTGPVKDRVPIWSPDGSRIAFYSNRSGKYEAWSVHPDGTGLEQMTRTRWESLTFPIWSPDAKLIACSIGSRSAAFIDLAKPIEQRNPRALPPPGPSGEVFAPASWSPDGLRLAGTLQKPDESPLPGVVLYTLASQRYDRLTELGENPVWFHDSSHLLFVNQGKVFCADVRTRNIRKVAEPAPHSSFSAGILAPGDRSLYLVRTTEEGDIWMLEMK